MVLGKKTIRVLICDDSALMRQILKRIIGSDPDLEVVGTARDGEDAVAKARSLNPDVVTMDINMPGMDGISALQLILHEKIAPVVMVSSLTTDGAEATFESLALGAFDYVTKPGGTVTPNMQPVEQEIIEKVKAAAQPGTLSRLHRPYRKRARKLRQILSATRKRDGQPSHAHGKAVAIGMSTGGPRTIFEVLPYLPEDFPSPVFIVQHMPATFIPAFANRLDANCPLPCVMAQPGMAVEPGHVYLAKGGKHMTLHRKPNGKVIIRTPSKPEHTFMPSVDVMMNSVLEIYGSNTIGVLMTGMGSDGADAMVRIQRAGGATIAESEETAIVFGMPREAIERGGAGIVVPAWDIASEIVKLVGNGFQT